MINPTICGPVHATLSEGERVSRVERQQAFYRPDGRLVLNGDIVSVPFRTVPCSQPPAPAERHVISGPVLFAGAMLEQFGHVLMNSLGRLWALEHLPPETRILYIPKRSTNPAKYAHTRNILQWLGFSGEFLLARDGTEFEALYTCPDIFGERHEGRGLPGFYEWVDRRLAPAPKIDPDLKIYVTRSALGPRVGRFTCEDHLEDQLQRQGYKIIAPETLSLEEQTQWFRTAGKLIFAESSALHLYALVCRPEQTGAVIKRRPDLPSLIATQLDDRNGGSFGIIDAIEDLYWPPMRGEHLSVSVLDFDRVGAELKELGLIDLSLGWQGPDASAQQRSLNAGLADGQHMMTTAQRRQFLKERRKPNAE